MKYRFLRALYEESDKLCNNEILSSEIEAAEKEFDKLVDSLVPGDFSERDVLRESAMSMVSLSEFKGFVLGFSAAMSLKKEMSFNTEEKMDDC